LAGEKDLGYIKWGAPKPMRIPGPEEQRDDRKQQGLPLISLKIAGKW